ncbi:MAG: hypothetical protein ACLT9P_05505 [Evtepia gabavorous]
MKPMLRYELCKLFARPSGKAALLLLAVLVAVSTFFACHVRYTDEEGQTQYGLSAVRQLRADQKAWAGPLDEAQLRRAIQANLDVRTSPDAQSEDVVRQDMAFHRQQAFEAIRDLLNSAYSEDFQAFDYFTADTLTPEDAPDFYANRVRLLQQWLEDNAFAFSQAEQNYLVQQYQALETPMYVDYTTGWQQFYEFSPTVIIILCLFACFLVSGIFSQEGQWKTDAIFFTTFHGRGRGFLPSWAPVFSCSPCSIGCPSSSSGESPWPSWGPTGRAARCSCTPGNPCTTSPWARGLFSLPWVDISAPCFWACCPCGSPPRAAPRCWPPCCPSQ